MIGKTLAHYEVTAMIGRGGMGEVYRAHDTKLDRDVALKILPRELSGDRERAARFEREARMLASLQHAHIASIYGYEEAEGIRFLAMELVEGVDLEQRLEQGALSINEALNIALQIAIGLEAAHDSNIVHRDLKPANIKIGPDGRVKILDFGLARAYTDDPDAHEDPTLSPTITAAMTQAGTILGTAAYMSPEQARGRSVDKRTDIWAFGVILYEMLAGTRLYDGETITDILGAIVHGRPNLELLPAKIPARVMELLARCLDPDVSGRLRDIGEARIVLSDPGAASRTQPAEARSSRGWIVATVAMAIVAIGVGAFALLQGSPAPQVIQSSIDIPTGHSIVATGIQGGSVRVSPDGKSIAFLVQKDGQQTVWIRPFEAKEGYPLIGTEGASRPFWSPDSRSIAFFVNGTLRRISISGGAPLTIAPVSSGRGGVWLDNGLIVYAPSPTAPLMAVPAGGGQPRQVTSGGNHREPRWLPKEDHFLFLENSGGGQWMMCIGKTDGSPHIELASSGGGAEYADGKILYLQGRTLVSHPIDLDRLQLTGEPEPLAEHIVRDPNFGIGFFSAAEGGVLCYLGGSQAGGRLLWKDKDGRETSVQGERAEYWETAISPDGTTLATIINDSDGGGDIWMIDVATDTRRRFTFTPDNAHVRRAELNWSGSGDFLVYAVEADSNYSAIYRRRADGSGDENLVLSIEGHNVWPYDVSSDDQWVVYGQQTDQGKEDLWITSLSGEGEPQRLWQTPYDEWPAKISPDQRWLAFDSDETGDREVYVVPFPEGRGRWQVSRNGGRFPRWNESGDRLYYIDHDGSIMQVAVDGAGSAFHPSEPVQMFESNLLWDKSGSYDVTGDGSRVIIIEPSAQNNPISLFMNWTYALTVR